MGIHARWTLVIVALAAVACRSGSRFLPRETAAQCQAAVVESELTSLLRATAPEICVEVAISPGWLPSDARTRDAAAPAAMADPPPGMLASHASEPRVRVKSSCGPRVFDRDKGNVILSVGWPRTDAGVVWVDIERQCARRDCVSSGDSVQVTPTPGGWTPGRRAPRWMS